jgi:hypothetical protein
MPMPAITEGKERIEVIPAMASPIMESMGKTGSWV